MQLRFGIRTKQILSILAILLVSYSTMLYSTMKTLSASLGTEIEKNLEMDLRYARTEYLRRADIVTYALKFPATSHSVQNSLKKRDLRKLADKIRRWHTVFPFLKLIVILDPQKRVLADLSGTGSEEPLNLPGVVDQAISLKKPVTSTEIVSSDFLRRNRAAAGAEHMAVKGELLMMTVVVPVFDDGGKLLGCLVTGEILNHETHMQEQFRTLFGKDVGLCLTQRDQRISCSFARNAQKLEPALLEKLERGEEFRGTVQVDNQKLETAIDPIQNSRGEFVGSLSISVSTERFNKMRYDNLWNILTSAFLGILCSFGLAFLASRQLTGPLRQLAGGVRKIEEGDLNQRVEERYGDEVGALAASFNKMVETLQERDRIINIKTRDLQELNDQLERKVVQRTCALTMEMGRLEAVLTSMAEGVVVTDRENRVILYNPASQQMFEMVPYRVMGRPIEEVCAMGGFTALVETIQELKRVPGGAGRNAELEVNGKKLKIYLCSLADEDGEFAGVVMSMRDVTAEEEVDRMKTEFISTVSHELKTPLTSMKGSLQLLLNRGKWLTETERQLLCVCYRNTQRLIRLIGEILDISGIESGGMAFNFRPVSIGEVAVYAVEEIKSYAMGRNISIVNTVGEHLPMVYGDRDRLIQVITNLLSNAVKFSPEGKVVMVTAEQDGEYVTLSVADRGKMIKKSDRHKLFKKFQQIEDAERQKVSGTGLGLAICKEIIERHHGRIFYSSPQEQGNVFSFTVPTTGEGNEQGQDSHC